MFCIWWGYWQLFFIIESKFALMHFIPPWMLFSPLGSFLCLMTADNSLYSFGGNSKRCSTLLEAVSRASPAMRQDEADALSSLGTSRGCLVPHAYLLFALILLTPCLVSLLLPPHPLLLSFFEEQVR